MPADQIKLTKVFERDFECQIMDKKNATRSESVLNQNTVQNIGVAKEGGPGGPAPPQLKYHQWQKIMTT